MLCFKLEPEVKQHSPHLCPESLRARIDGTYQSSNRRASNAHTTLRPLEHHDLVRPLQVLLGAGSTGAVTALFSWLRQTPGMQVLTPPPT